MANTGIDTLSMRIAKDLKNLNLSVHAVAYIYGIQIYGIMNAFLKRSVPRRDPWCVSKLTLRADALPVITNITPP